mmetsp:Transcript_1466/g.1920  ORF Transcript_1466/g.1920 Transcript_1466/m.1920 type:complete len:184 (+) Transcript_1466:149-700(+)
MGGLFSGLWSRLGELWSGKQIKILLVGLDNAGKTTTLYHLVLDQVIETAPTVGSNVEQFNFKNMCFLMWDLGGQETCRESWSTYYSNTAAVIFVVDSTDRERVPISYQALNDMLRHEDLKGAAFLVFANKQDQPNAMSAAEITEQMSLHSIKEHNWHIQKSCALTGQGLFEGLEWLVKVFEEK